MNDFERELRKMFEDNKILTDTRFVGKVCFGKISDTVNARIEFATQGTSEHYPALKTTLINKNDGVVDSLTLNFRDTLGSNRTYGSNDFNHDRPQMWTYNGKTEWYGYQPTATDYSRIARAVTDYLELFHEPIQENLAGFTQQM